MSENKTWAISLAHMEPTVIAMSLTQFLRTNAGASLPDWTLVDHHWPLDPENFKECLKSIAPLVSARIISPEKNLGGHGGFTWAMNHLPIGKHDFVLGYDPDSYPITSGWMSAMKAVLRADPAIGSVSLWHTGISGRDWRESMVGGYRVRTFPHAEMLNVTMWRASYLLPSLEGEYAYYGQVEWPMYRRAQRLGLKQVYLTDYHETQPPIAHPKIYTDWKQAHISHKFKGNFSEWVDHVKSQS